MTPRRSQTQVWMRLAAVLIMLCCTVLSTSCDEPKVSPRAVPEAPEVPAYCDAGDAAWVRRAMPVLWGRTPHSTVEVAAWVRAVEVAGREAVVAAMAADPAFIDYQTDVWMDDLGVPRAGSRADRACWSHPLYAVASADPTRAHETLGAALVEATPDVELGPGFNMADVMTAALRIDDVSIVWRAALFARLHRPLTGANVGPIELEENRRIDLGDEFYEGWLGRRLDCLPCHNGAWSATDDDDPELDRTWAVPGLFELALFGDHTGRDIDSAYAVFRTDGLIDGPDATHRPFGLFGCGTVALPEQLGPDLLEEPAWLGGPLGESGSVWNVEARLHAGIDALRGTGRTWSAEDAPTTDEALAWLLAEGIVDTAWRQATGGTLTLVHGFPRNAEQQRRLDDFTDRFTAAGFSLVGLYQDILTDPAFSPGLATTCGAPATELPPVYDPYTVDDDDPARRGNGPGDRVRRWPGRVLVRSLHSALGWRQPGRMPVDDAPVREIYEGLGVKLRRAQPRIDGVDVQGLLAWDLAAGTCEPLGEAPGSSDGCTSTSAIAGCGNCGCEACTCALDSYCCTVQWDDTCVATCEADCGGCGRTAEPDTITRLIEAAVERDATVGDLLVALKDRLLTDPTLSAEEAELMGALLAVDPSVPVADVADDPSLEAGLRTVCGVLLRSAGFVLDLEDDAIDGVVDLALDVSEDCDRMQTRMSALGHTVSCEGL